MPYDFSDFDKKLSAAHDWLHREYQGLRTGRATPAILDGVSVSAYGSIMPLKQVGNVSVEDARTLRVIPWDAGLVKDIERGITNANLGLGISADQSGIRVTFPELTGERRAELIKAAKGKLEDARATVRVARDEERKALAEKEKEGGMGEDEKFRLTDEIQKKVDAMNEQLEKTFASKEKEMSA